MLPSPASPCTALSAACRSLRPLAACSNEQRTSHGAHQLSLGVFAMLAALAAGRPLGEPLTFLRGVAPSDPVVAAALQSVSECSGWRGGSQLTTALCWAGWLAA